MSKDTRTREGAKSMAKKMGRPVTEIDKEQLEKLCGFFNTLNDVADFFDCSTDTIERYCKRTYGETFADVYKRKSASGRRSIRRAQFVKGTQDMNPQMLIWLGKQYLGQKDSIAYETTDLDTTRKLIINLGEPDSESSSK